MHSIPLCHQHPGGTISKGIFTEETFIYVSGSIVDDQIAKIWGVPRDKHVSDCSFPAYVNITPEWTEDKTQPRGFVAGWKPFGMRKPPWIHE